MSDDLRTTRDEKTDRGVGTLLRPLVDARRTMRFERIADSAAAADGGSLALILERVGGGRAALVLNRSFKARGTPEYDSVTFDGAPLSMATSAEFLLELSRLQAALVPAERAKHPVSPLLAALRKQSVGP